MDRSCARAVELGLPSIAFTEHADWIRGDDAVFDAEGYFGSLERCRSRYSSLRILSGVEMGEPHRFKAEAEALLKIGFDRVLASVHCIDWKGRTKDAATDDFLTPEDAEEMFRWYLGDVLALLKSDLPFDVLAHLDYPKRYWPDAPGYDETLFEEEFRTVLGEAAKRGVALEINTTRGREPGRYLCPGATVLGWWSDEGGSAVSFGSDAHRPDHIAAGFGLAQEAAAAAGFKAARDALAFWTR
jgi:histidinol-phosphatase (PHP family)